MSSLMLKCEGLNDSLYYVRNIPTYSCSPTSSYSYSSSSTHRHYLHLNLVLVPTPPPILVHTPSPPRVQNHLEGIQHFIPTTPPLLPAPVAAGQLDGQVYPLQLMEGRYQT